MSDVKRYEFMSDGYSARFLDPKTGHAAPKGEYVTLEDYARLKAERDGMRRCLDKGQKDWVELCAQMILSERDNTALKAENERLRKAGDWMREALEEGPIDYQCRIDRWNVAKEGKQS